MEFRIIPKSRFDAVIDHLKKSFCDEPLCSSTGLVTREKTCDHLIKYYQDAMEEGMSVMAVDKNSGEILGVALNATLQNGDIEKELEKLKTVDSIPFRRVFSLLYETNKELDLFNKFGLDKLFELQVLSVDSRYRRKGIGKELIFQSEQLAVEKGFKLIKIDAASCFTRKASKSLGYTVLKTISYGDYKDDNGMRTYPTKYPHEYYKVTAKVLPGTV